MQITHLRKVKIQPLVVCRRCLLSFKICSALKINLITAICAVKFVQHMCVLLSFSQTGIDSRSQISIRNYTNLNAENDMSLSKKSRHRNLISPSISLIAEFEFKHVNLGSFIRLSLTMNQLCNIHR